jgi:hypothetical protein
MSDEEQNGRIRSFAQTAAMMDGGNFDRKAQGQLEKLIKQMQAAAINNGGLAKGSMTIKIDFKVDGSIVEMSPTISTSAPKSRFGKSVLWADDQGLTVQNPNQMTMDLRPVPDGQQIQKVGE